MTHRTESDAPSQPDEALRLGVRIRTQQLRELTTDQMRRIVAIMDEDSAPSQPAPAPDALRELLTPSDFGNLLYKRLGGAGTAGTVSVVVDMLHDHLPALAACLDSDSPQHPSHRWNIEGDESGVRICFHHHERSEDCEWVEFVPQAPISAPDALRERLRQILARYDAGEIDAQGGLGIDVRVLLAAPVPATGMEMSNEQ